MTDIPEAVQQGARSVSWLAVHRFVLPLLNAVDEWPMAGTPEWCSLPQERPAKWAALLDGAQHWALRIEMNQQALADASRDIAGAEDWLSFANEFRALADFRRSNPWTKRIAS